MSLQSCIGCGESSRNEYKDTTYPSYSSSSSSDIGISTSSSQTDENITNSREREQELRDAGMEALPTLKEKPDKNMSKAVDTPQQTVADRYITMVQESSKTTLE